MISPSAPNFWRIHLATALVLMLLSSIILGLNICPMASEEMVMILHHSRPFPNDYVIQTQGWPFEFRWFAALDTPFFSERMDYQQLGGNCMTFVLLNIAVFLILEGLIRRRDAKVVRPEGTPEIRRG